VEQERPGGEGFEEIVHSYLSLPWSTTLDQPLEEREARDIDEEIKHRPDPEKRLISAVIPEILHAMASGSSKELRALEGALREATDSEHDLPEDPEELTPELARRLDLENLFGVWADYQELEERSVSGESLSARARVTRQRLEQLRSAGRLVGIRIPFRRSYYYPTWQFDLATGEMLLQIYDLERTAAEVGMDHMALDGFMTNPEAGDGVAPGDVFQRGPEGRQAVLEWIAAARSGGN
jgi:hypothetical protein